MEYFISMPGDSDKLPVGESQVLEEDEARALVEPAAGVGSG